MFLIGADAEPRRQRTLATNQTRKYALPVISRYWAELALEALPEWCAPEVTHGSVARAKGDANAHSEITAPFSGRSCVFFQLVLQEWEHGILHPLAILCSRTPFYVETTTTRMLFDAVGCKAFLSAEPVTGKSADSSGEVEKFLRSLGENPHLSYAPSLYQRETGNLRWEERVVPRGTDVQVAGTLGSRPDPQGLGTYRQPPSIPSLSHPRALLLV